MARTDNYALQARQAKDRFLTYDQNGLIQKLGLDADGEYLYVTMLAQRYRISRTTGDMDRQIGTGWVEANSFAEVMTLLDLVCDSREDRYVSGRWKNMQAFGLMFHKDLLENSRDPWAERFARNPEGLAAACRALGGRKLPTGDVAYAIEVFDGLPVAIQLWIGDEEFPSNLRLMWDENADRYIRYETMYYAKSLLLNRLQENLPEE